MSSKVSSLNLYDSETKTNKLDIDVSNANGVVLAASGGLEITCNSPFNLFHASGTIIDLATHVKTIEQNIADGAAGSAVASAQVQSNLLNYAASTNTTIGTIQSNLSNEIAQRAVGQASDATARASLSSDLSDLISSEETRASISEGLISDAVSAETNARTTADTTLQTNIDVERVRVDNILSGASVDLDTLNALTNAYQTADTSLLTQITAMQTQITSLQATIDELTSSA